MLAGRPQAELPSRYTVARDIKTSFERCSRRIDELLQVWCLSYFMSMTTDIYIYICS